LRRATSAISAFFLVLGAARSGRAEDTPRLDWHKPVRCLVDPRGEAVRVQCDEAQRVCLVASNKAADGSELRRSRPCDVATGGNGYLALERSGARLVPAVAEAPPGFARADNGRAYQVQFDLLNRVYVGAAWTPTYQRPDPRLAAPPGFPLGRGRVEIGFEATVLSPRGRSRHDFRVLEGSATFSDLNVSGLVFAYDYQQDHRRPAFWVTTFVGKPHLYGVPIPLGWGFRVVRVEDRPPSFRKSLDFEIAETHLSWDPWQSRDLYGHLRFEAGADVGKHLQDRTAGFAAGDWYVGPTGAVHSRFSLGQGGLHYLAADLDFGRPTVLVGDRAGKSMLRLQGTFAYEAVLLAINDQPFSVRLAAGAGTREDPASGARSVELGGTAGLRFSFWAPARAVESLPDVEDP
jgi:hypothetical protein